MSLGDRLHDLDRFQQRHRRLAFPAAVVKKFTDDQGGQLAALISYYGFVSLFPLLLVFVTILGFVLQGDHAEQQKILSGALGQFPIVSSTLKPQSLKGSPTALAIGLIGAVLAGLGIMSAAQTAFDRIWSVPFKHRPNFIGSRLRSLAMLALLGSLSIVSTVIGGFVGTGSHSTLDVVLSIVLAFTGNFLLFMLAFKVLTAADVAWRDLRPGAITAAVLWQLLQHLGGYYVDHELKHTQPLYGVFALVLGLLAWLYLGAQLTMVAAEVNVVKARRLWPRSFFNDPLLDADRRALTHSAETEERVPQEDVDVSFDEDEHQAEPR
ncbi:MAG TPA: YihY/virulence factor BrkB family protein [Solirubrobacteraceae bacterium]